MLPLLTLLSCLTLAAQNGAALRVEPAEISKVIRVDNIDEDFEDVSTVVVTNNSGRTIQLLRENVVRESPRSWSYTALDRASRTTPYVVSADDRQQGRQISLRPGESATFFVVLRPEGIAGTGTTELRFSDLTFPGTTLASASISTTVARQDSQTDPPGSTEAATTVRLYPNPATDRFFVETPRSVRLGRVEVTNTLGRRIKSFSGESGADGFDIATLPDGLYLISIFDDSGRKLRTLRLLHRRFGA
ncbi:putative secreted protein (Por secretion system target) [Neolewinella xylanilytica]|uniref:Putative secreted protein (Por secretion system target) n=2 Tax=Neolewinella xylanilytica TaxID=1514080 RepID=A0A2S6I1Q9_9BACT|nr:putative secreted protein (Por secretion system target) [Neolewinella xylanilytica]